MAGADHGYNSVVDRSDNVSELRLIGDGVRCGRDCLRKSRQLVSADLRRGCVQERSERGSSPGGKVSVFPVSIASMKLSDCFAGLLFQLLDVACAVD